MKLAICSEVWRDVPLETVFAKAKQIGFDGVELAPFTLADDVREISPSRRQQMVRAAADAGVAIVGLHWLFVSPKGLHLTTPDAAVRATASASSSSRRARQDGHARATTTAKATQLMSSST